ncbi:hypothetical protein, partial [Petrotoga halophila]|uniref:hypothetical protein n=1 Tax=Petrotoga halophila TaxID=301141 RepID=UPI001B80B390
THKDKRVLTLFPLPAHKEPFPFFTQSYFTFLHLKKLIKLFLITGNYGQLLSIKLEKLRFSLF